MEIEKRRPFLALKIPKFCLSVAWDIMNIFLHCAGIQFSTEMELKILDQIHHLNIC
jgi:hypothetical protein